MNGSPVYYVSTEWSLDSPIYFTNNGVPSTRIDSYITPLTLCEFFLLIQGGVLLALESQEDRASQQWYITPAGERNKY